MQKLLALALIGFIALFNTGCDKVPAGHVGIKVYLLGGAKGVESETLGVGRYWIGWNEDLFLFPTFAQNDVWKLTADKDESLTFGTKEGLSVGADMALPTLSNQIKFL